MHTITAKKRAKFVLSGEIECLYAAASMEMRILDMRVSYYRPARPSIAFTDNNI